MLTVPSGGAWVESSLTSMRRIFVHIHSLYNNLDRCILHNKMVDVFLHAQVFTQSRIILALVACLVVVVVVV